MRYFGYSLHEAECMTLREYSYEMFAYSLRRIDEERDMHMQAFLNHVVTGTKQRGKKTVPVYKTFQDFYDYEKEIKRITEPSPLKKEQKVIDMMTRTYSL
jgi:16S rRNA U1498 N3-methylase RsmE